jgi:prepilin-type N-terminal cleavage/methylation domain-containing protein
VITMPIAGSPKSRGFTLIEAMVASAVLLLALAALYGAMAAGRGMSFNAQQRLDAEALAFDKALEVFNTTDFGSIRIATNLASQGVPSSSILAASSEIRVGIFPNTGTPSPFKWDIEVRVKRGRVAGGPPATPENDVVMTVTRYAVDRN